MFGTSDFTAPVASSDVLYRFGFVIRTESVASK